MLIHITVCLTRWSGTVVGRLVITYPTQLRPWVPKFSYTLAVDNRGEECLELWEQSSGQVLLFGLHYAANVDYQMLRLLPALPAELVNPPQAQYALMIVESLANLVETLATNHKLAPEMTSGKARATMARLLVVWLWKADPETEVGSRPATANKKERRPSTMMDRQQNDALVRMRERAITALVTVLHGMEPGQFWRKLRHLVGKTEQSELKGALCEYLPPSHPLCM
jgi:hypothetical protein